MFFVVVRALYKMCVCVVKCVHDYQYDWETTTVASGRCSYISGVNSTYDEINTKVYYACNNLRAITIYSFRSVCVCWRSGSISTSNVHLSLFSNKFITGISVDGATCRAGIHEHANRMR